MNILEEIVTHKKQEVEKNKKEFPLEKLKKQIEYRKINKNIFLQTLKNKVEKKEVALIAEIKKASPSKGVLVKDFEPVHIAEAYMQGGACCLSVLTDKKYFQGDLSYINEIKKSINLPILRKDFIIDPYQIYESVYHKSDCILLIVSALEKDLFKRLFEASNDLGIDSLIEVHNERELEIALDVAKLCHGMPLLGINNRDLRTFATNINITKDLVAKYKKDLEGKILVSESGIFTNKDIKSLIESDVYAFLVGEGLVKEKDIEKATRVLIGAG